MSVRNNGAFTEHFPNRPHTTGTTYSQNEHFDFTRNRGENHRFNFGSIMEYGHRRHDYYRYERECECRHERQHEYSRYDRDDNNYDREDRYQNYGRGNGGGGTLPMILGAVLGFLGMFGGNNAQNNQNNGGYNDGQNNGNYSNGAYNNSNSNSNRNGAYNNTVNNRNNGVNNRNNANNTDAEAKAKAEAEAKLKAEADKAKAEAEKAKANKPAETTAYKVQAGDTLTKIIAGKNPGWSQEQIQTKVTEIINNKANNLGTYEANFGQMITPDQIINI